MAVLYLLSGITIVRSDEVAVMLRWGRLVGDTPALQEHGPGLLFAFPRPMDQVVRVQVKHVCEISVVDITSPASEEDEGDEPTLSDASNPLTQGYAVTGDQNIVHVNMVARYRVRDPAEWAFYGPKSEERLRVEVTAAMVRSLGEMGVDRVLSDGRKDLIAIATSARRPVWTRPARVWNFLARTHAPGSSAGTCARFDAVQSAYIGAETAKKDGPGFRRERNPAGPGRSGLRGADRQAADLRTSPRPKERRRRFWRSTRSIAPTPRWFASASIGMAWNGPSNAGNVRWIPPPPMAAATTDSASRCSGRQRFARPAATRRRGRGRAMSDLLSAGIEYHSRATARACRPLDTEERRRISVTARRGADGHRAPRPRNLLVRLEPDQWQIGELCRGLGRGRCGDSDADVGPARRGHGRHRRATDQLVAIAVLAAAATGDFVTATLIPLFLELGRLFEERSSLGARAAIDGIRALGARQAVRWRNGAEERVDPDSLRPGDEILVRPGERIAVDGTVLEGRAAVDQSAITGESLHEDVGPGSPVFAGTVAHGRHAQNPGSRAGRRYRARACGQLLAEVERLRPRAAPLRAARAGLAAAGAYLAASTLFFTQDLSRAIAVLVVATPTALVVAGPAASRGGDDCRHASSHPYQERGFPRARLRRRHADSRQDRNGDGGRAGGHGIFGRRPGESEETLLAVAASCGFGSLHPVSRAVVAEALSRGIVQRAARRIFRSGPASAWWPWSMASKPSSAAGLAGRSRASLRIAGRRGRLAGVGRTRRKMSGALRAARSAPRGARDALAR